MKKAQRGFAFGLCVVLAFLMSTTGYAQDKMEITAAELRQGFKEGRVVAGYNTVNGCAWMNVYLPDEKSIQQYYNCSAGVMVGTSVGTVEIFEDNRMCSEWDDGRVQCTKSYKTGEDKRELWIEKPDGSFYFAGTFYRVK